ncbi:hypothetical protein BJX99DRAFT_230576 [Aspergillus californicus]
MNGATQTFRRPSVATNPTHSRDPTSITTPTGGAYPPHMASNLPGAVRNGAVGDTRYSKEQLLDLYKAQRDNGIMSKNITDSFVAEWDPHTETPAANGAWGKRDDQKDNPSGPEVCWDHGGQIEPLALLDMSDDEKEAFSGSVNSPLKPPPTNATKENTGTPGTGRRTSVSQAQGNNANPYSTSSPTSARPGPRRRETGESIVNPMSPTTSGSRFFRDEPNTAIPPPSLLRRKTDFRDTTSVTKWEEKEKESQGRETAEAPSPFGSLKRSSTNPVALAGSTSPWPPSASQSASFAPMGSFGAFSMGTNSATPTPTTEKRPGFGSLRGESRLKGLFSKDSMEDISSIKEKPSLSNLERLGESDAEGRSQSPWGEPFKTRTGRSETNPFSDEPRSGSAALGGSQDVSTPSQAAADHPGFSAFGMTPSIPGFRDLMQSHENSRNPTPNLHGREPTSPTNTNPYQSPHHGDRGGDGDDVDTDGSDVQNTNHPGISGLRDSTPFGSVRRVGSGMDLPSAVDRSQTSSVAGSRSFSNLGALSGLSSLGGASGWPSSAAVGTPTKERSGFPGGFGDPIFGSMADLQSPSLSTLGGGGLFSPHPGISSTGSIGRSSKLGSLFPQAMQEQLQSDQLRQDLNSLDDTQQADTHASALPGAPAATTSTSHTPVSAVGSISTSLAPEGQQQTQVSGNTAGSLSTAQQRTMVMPDRMRWIYRDPQGNIQGPWTGLEMHDWFKAGFFSPDLQIRKLEDVEFEPLAQLVRRIGNSREPFLVPQIGLPHGPEPNAATWGGTATAGNAQPPFPGSFPSFGTTLTAEQQNALERRKQEEQYLMARQKEHLAQQQALMKQMSFPSGTSSGAPSGVPHGIHPPQLQHHSSAHSLHSQPSIGSITSPLNIQPSPIQGPLQQQQQQPPGSGFFDAPGPIRPNPLPNVGSQMIGTDFLNSSNQEQLPTLLERLNVNSRSDPFSFGSPTSFASRQPDNLFHNQQVASMLQDRQRLQQEQDQFDSVHGDSLFDQQAREERLRQFHALRAQDGEFGLRHEGLPTHPAFAPSQTVEGGLVDPDFTLQGVAESLAEDEEPVLTLSQQVQKAAQEQEQQEQQALASSDSVWAVKSDPAMPQPFPPPPSASPLPAPAAQRNRQNVAESLAANSRSQTQTPVEAPATSIAPWAKEVNEMPKGPSLKEIQEAEARNAAQREESAAAARRAQLLAEQERLNHAQVPAAPGLPSTANWASAGSPATPTSVGSPWNTKGAATTTSSAKKTLAQIQKEEEARKQRLAAAAAAAAAQNTVTPSPVPSSAGKRYADLASKAAPAASPVSAGTGAWTTVGASGKAKAPPGSVAPTAPRSTSGPIPLAASPVRPKPVAAVTAAPRALPVSTPSNSSRAMEEFNKWAKLTLGKGLNININVDDFVQQLQLLPAEAEIISDSVYANSQTLDGRRFAEEYIRRRKLADKGIVESVSASALEQKNGGGWSEVAKKGSSSNINREEDTTSAAFKVVAPRKKGKR